MRENHKDEAYTLDASRGSGCDRPALFVTSLTRTGSVSAVRVTVRSTDVRGAAQQAAIYVGCPRSGTLLRASLGESWAPGSEGARVVLQ